MRRFSNIIVCTLALVFCLAVVSAAQQPGADAKARTSTTAPRPATPNVVKPATALAEGTTVIYSNFGAGDAYNCCIGWTETGVDSGYTSYIQSMAFTPTKATYILTQLDLALTWYGIGTNGAAVLLCGDDYGIPGRVIDSWFFTGLPDFGSTSSAVETIPINEIQKTIVLVQNARYWLVVIPYANEWAVWNWNSTSASGYGAYLYDGGDVWYTEDYSPNGAFDVLGTVLPQAPGE